MEPLKPIEELNCAIQAKTSLNIKSFQVLPFKSYCVY